MAIVLHGKIQNGKVELDNKVLLPDGSEITVIIEEGSDDNRFKALNDILVSARKELNISLESLRRENLY